MTKLELRTIITIIDTRKKSQIYPKARCLLNIDFWCPVKKVPRKPLKISLNPCVQILFIQKRNFVQKDYLIGIFLWS